MNSIAAEIIFEKAIDIADAAERTACIKAECKGDATLRRDVETLVAAYTECGSFMKTPVLVDSPGHLPQLGAGGHFGDYELIEEIARGGMGVVYKARQVSLNRIVAIKMILAGQFASNLEVKRFRTEAQAGAGLSHPNLVAIYEVGECQGQQYYTMPFVEGRSLSQVVDSGDWHRGNGTEAAGLVARLARAVQFAHDAGVLHRDLKPGNILINSDGEPCITDFGLAKRVNEGGTLTVSGGVMGTPGFMAPEQARGKSAHTGPGTDIYSLGAILYYLLTGRPPFVADSLLDGLMLVLEGEAVLPRRINPRVPGPLQQICMRCLQKRPEDRYATAGALAQDLERFIRGESTTASSPAIGRRFEAWAKRQPALAARLWTVLLCLGVVVVAYQLHHYTTPNRHLAVIGVLILWLAVSYACQLGVQSERHAGWVRYVWSSADPLVLTAVLLIAQGFRGPLVALYPTLIAVSGFWLRVPMVITTTLVALLGYLVLLLESGGARTATIPAHWHIIAIIATIVTGLAVAYMVNRANALTRFYERRQPTVKD